MGEYKVWVDDTGIVRGAIFGTHDKDDAKKVIEEMNILIKQSGKDCKVLIDMSETGRPTYEARKLHASNINIISKYFKKAAFFGATTMNRVLANFIIKAAGIGDSVKYFNTQDEAIKWLLT
jgi:hypothetical protein